MYTKTPTGRNSKGTPSLETFQGRLRIRFRVDGQQKTFSLGLADTSESRVKGESIACQMHLDMLANNFDGCVAKNGGGDKLRSLCPELTCLHVQVQPL